MIWLAVFGLVAVVIIIIILVISRRKLNQKKLAVIKAQDKLREEALDRMILNESAEVDDIRAQAERAFSVNYGQAGLKRGTDKRLMLEIEEISDFSVRKFMLNPIPAISVGSARGNTIELPSDVAEAKHCEIGIQDGLVYVTSFGTDNSVWVSRRNTRRSVGGKRLAIENGDTIQIGAVKLKVKFVYAAEG